jgi:putative AdoMet-dependent methyltransferase
MLSNTAEEAVAVGTDESREFDEWADHYDESVSSRNDFPFRGYEAALKQVVTEAAVERPCRVLDLGIGTGNLAARFAELGCRIWGIDFSRKMLSQAKLKVPEAHLGQADLLGPWPEEFRQRFDRIVSAYVLHHFELAEKIELLVRLCRDHCAEAARIVVADISFPTMDALRQERIRSKDQWDEEQYWIADQAIPACERAGLRVRHKQVDDFAGVYVFEPRANPRMISNPSQGDGGRR